MKPTDTILEEIDNILLKWEDNRSLANGGCCLAAYEVARLLEQHNIKFSLMMYVDRLCDAMRKPKPSPEEICDSDGCMHMAIVVKYQGNLCSLGVDERFDKLITNYGAVVRQFRQMTAERIQNLEKLGKWDSAFDRNQAEELRQELEEIFK